MIVQGFFVITRSNYFFTTSEIANNNLKKSGVKEDSIFFVGNTMIDTLLANKSRFVKPEIWDVAHLMPGEYLVMTLHRPANVDQEENLKLLIEELIKTAKGLKIIFPVHPRTRQVLNKLTIDADNLILIEPQSYLRFNYLVQHAKAVITDSSGTGCSSGSEWTALISSKNMDVSRSLPSSFCLAYEMVRYCSALVMAT